MIPLKYEACRSCVNRELDPEVCNDCDNADLYEAPDIEDADDIETLSYEQFLDRYRDDLA